MLIVDEPTLGLAPRVADEVLTLFSELRDEGVTVLLVGERPHGLVDVADQVSLISAGRITWSGSPSNLDQATLEESYFGEDLATYARGRSGEVRLADDLALHHLGGRPVSDHAAELEHADLVAVLHHERYVVLDEQHAALTGVAQ